MFSKVHIITTSNVDIMEQEEMPIPKNVIIYKAKTKDFRTVVTRNNHYAESMKNSWLVNTYLKLKKTLPFHFYIGEGGNKYKNASLMLAKEIIARNPISHVYSSFMPYIDHRIASIIKRQNPTLKWIADFRDLQVEPIYKNIYFPKWNKKQEKKILQNADLVTTVSEGLANQLKTIHSNVISIPRGIELRANEKEQYTPFTIAYTGNLYKSFRDGLFFVRGLASFIKEYQIQDIQFIYAGRDSAQWQNWFDQCGISSVFKDHGFVTKLESKNIQNKAHLLLLLSSSSDEQQGVLTGKLFEYLETANPILNIINGVKDQEFEALFEDLDAGSILYTSSNSTINLKIKDYYEAYKNGSSKKPSDKGLEARKKLTWAHRAKTMINAC